MKKFFSSTLSLLLLLIGSVIFASPAQAGDSPNIVICHRTGPTHGIPERPLPRFYSSPTVSKTAIVNGKSEHATDATDIIPPFEYSETKDGPLLTYPGKNWDAEGQAIYNNGCVVPRKNAVPVAPVFDQATCMLKNGLLTASEQGEGVELVQAPTLINGVWSVVYKPASGYTFPEGTSGTYAFEVTPPGPTDPNWDAEAGECRIANTGATGFSNTALMLGGGGVGLAAILLFVSSLMKRRENA